MLCSRAEPHLAAVETVEHFVALCPAAGAGATADRPHHTAASGAGRRLADEGGGSGASRTQRRRPSARPTPQRCVKFWMTPSLLCRVADAAASDLSPPLARWVSLVLAVSASRLPTAEPDGGHLSCCSACTSAAHNGLALMWRARARCLGGVPALVRDRGRTDAPAGSLYVRFKRLSVR